MNTRVTARHKTSSSSNERGLPQRATTKTNVRGKSGKVKKKSNLPLIIIGGVCCVFISFWVFLSRAALQLDLASNQLAHHVHQIHHPSATYKESNVRKAKAQEVTEPEAIHNPYEGWQPVDNVEKGEKCKSWRTCFKESHGCPGFCRDSEKSFGKAPPRPGFHPEPGLSDEEYNTKAQAIDWVPDVTVLRRMYKAGKDEHGNPWPPPLVTKSNREFCEEIGVFGGTTDQNKDLLDAVPIRGMPMLSDWSEAAMTTKKMKRQPKILCMVYTMEKNHHTNIRVIRETWGPGCDGFLAFSTKDDPRIPAISLAHDGAEEYENMWQKVRSIWRFVGTHYLEDFDFFFQGGEDLYVLPQNLRNYLADAVEDPTKEDFFGGRRFRSYDKTFFNSGGAGYALSQATLRKLINTGIDHPDCYPKTHSSMEDVFIARCLKKVFNIGLVDTRDDQERERFHPFSPGGHYYWQPPGPGGQDWYADYNTLWPPKLKEMCCAPDSVSFHYMKKPAMVRHLHALLYFCD